MFGVISTENTTRSTCGACNGSVIYEGIN